MRIFQHRRNSEQLLRATPRKYGVEIDLRSNGSDLIVHHDPFAPGELFTDWLRSYSHSGIILNVKEEGLEENILDLMERFGISEFFFLDQSFPFLLRTATAGERRCCVRFSEYESIQTVFSLTGLVEWVWVDCFSRLPLTVAQFKELKQRGFMLCFVSPELQGRNSWQEISSFVSEVKSMEIKPDAVCTKAPDIWEATFAT